MILTEQQIKKIAAKIKELKLVTPCMFLLEAHIPFSSVFHTLSIGVAPMFVVMKGYDTVPNFFSDRENIENLIKELAA